MIFHLILTSKIDVDSYGQYLKDSYMAKTTAGGLLFSLISFLLVKFLTVVGAYITLSIVLAIFVGLIIDYINVDKEYGHTKVRKGKFNFEDIESFEMDEDVAPKTKEDRAKKIAKRRLGIEKGETTIISSSMPTIDLSEKKVESRPMSKRDYILTPIDPVIPPENTEDLFLDSSTGYFNSKKIEKPLAEDKKVEFSNIEEIKPQEQEFENIEEEIYEEPKQEFTYAQPEEKEDEDDFLVDEEIDDSEYSSLTTREDNADLYNEIEDLEDINEEYQGDIDDEIVEENVDLSHENYIEDIEEPQEITELGSTIDTEVVRPSVDISKFNIPNMVQTKSLQPEEEKPQAPKEKISIPPYIAPPVELLNYMDNPFHITDEELQDNIDRLEQVLEDFKVPAKVNNVQVGPAVTRYELTMPRGISVNKIAQMSDDIAMTLASNGAIRVEAPIPGKNSVGIEVPNAQVSPVSLRELIDSNDFRVRGNPLSFVLGKDINGDIIFCNLDKMPHLLVAGSTGSGKSVCLNTLILSMCYKAGPQDLRLILIDPKMVEFAQYNGLPHLLIPEVITNKVMAINALDWAIKEMERRYALFAKNHVVNINEFNKLELVKNDIREKLPYIVIIADELADLMLEAKREIEDKIAKLAAKARAAGIHLVLATQRPSVDVITGTVKANLPSRIAFALTNYMDSKTVLDGGGAEKLLGKGDMLFKPQDKPEPRRVQGAYVSNEEIYAVVEYIKDKNKPVYDEDAGTLIKKPKQDPVSENAGGGAQRDQEFDPVLKDALKMFIATRQASGSMISRRFSVGFNRAGRIMDQMEMAGFIGPQEGSKPRQVLITMDEYRAIFGDN
ncbi:MAG: DNA translocase FtsK [Clostridia bacterium]|nr:DNA translocase FtsK [Clostridia bacterium]